MKEIHVHQAVKHDQTRWDEFVQRSNNGTIFHTLRFQEYHRPGRFNYHNLMFFEENKLMAVLPGYIKDGEFVSPAGASYGSFVTGDISLSLSNEIVMAFNEYCQRNHFRKVKMTYAPLPYMRYLNQNIEFTMLYHGYDYMYHLFTSVINLSLINPDDVLSGFYPNARRNVKKSLRCNEICVEINQDYERYYPILVTNKKKFNLLPTHALEEMKTIARFFPEKVFLFMCYWREKPIAGIWVLECTPSVILTFYIASLYEYQEYRPINRLFYEIIKWGIARGYSYMDLGVSMNTASDNPMEPSPNLIAFKESVGSRGFLRSTLEKIFI